MYEIGQPEAEAVAAVIASGQLFRYAGGRDAARTAAFERSLAAAMGVRHALATTSGTASLICALTGLGIGPGDEVIVPGYSFIATALAPLALGAVPVIVEIDETLTLDPAATAAAITPYTRAIIPVHMAGRPCDMAALVELARARGIPLVEDACQAVGGSWRGARLGSLGEAGAFSFNFFKNITCGEGGAVLTGDDRIFQRALIMHDGANPFFIDRSGAAQPTDAFAGMNFRISEIQAAILAIQLGRLDGILANLRRRRDILVAALADRGGWRLARSNDDAGDCGSHLALHFADEAAALGFIAHHRDAVGLVRPKDSGRHVYCNWEAVMERRPRDARLDPWRMARREITYARDMCPRTLDVLGRTVLVQVPYARTLAEVEAIARRLAGTA